MNWEVNIELEVYKDYSFDRIVSLYFRRTINIDSCTHLSKGDKVFGARIESFDWGRREIVAQIDREVSRIPGHIDELIDAGFAMYDIYIYD